MLTLLNNCFQTKILMFHVLLPMYMYLFSIILKGFVMTAIVFVNSKTLDLSKSWTSCIYKTIYVHKYTYSNLD